MLNTHDVVKAKHDVTRCLVCNLRFGSDDIRLNVYKDERFVGVIHDTCYVVLPCDRFA